MKVILLEDLTAMGADDWREQAGDLRAIKLGLVAACAIAVALAVVGVASGSMVMAALWAVAAGGLLALVVLVGGEQDRAESEAGR